MITKVLGAEIALPTTTGTATSFSEARRVRLINLSGANRVITIVETQSGGVIGSFSLLLEINFAPIIFSGVRILSIGLLLKDTSPFKFASIFEPIIVRVF